MSSQRDGASLRALSSRVLLLQDENQELRSRLNDLQRVNNRLKSAVVETHHRIRNHLQTVSALTDVIMAEHQASIPREEVCRIGRHVRSIAVIDGMLMNEMQTVESVDSLSVRGTLERLIMELRTIAGTRGIKLTVDDVPLHPDVMKPLALVLTEVVTNAVKYGRGSVELSFRAEGGVARLEVCDDGPGFPAAFDPKVSGSTGMQVIEALCRLDLRGEVAYANREGGGARVIVTFPYHPPRTAAELS